MSKVKLLLDLVRDVRVVADDLQAVADTISNDKAEKAIRLEDVRAVLAAKSRDGYGVQVRELIARHGGSKLSDISPDKYAAMLKEAEVFGDAT